MGAEQLDFTGGMNTSPEAIEAVISRMCHFVAAKDAEIAKLRADLAAARAALKVEREACDEYLYRCQDVRCVEDPGDKQCPLCAATSARRAAESKGEPK